MKYIKSTKVKQLAKEYGKEVTKEYLITLDAWIEAKVMSSCRIHNGGRKRLAAALLEFSK